MKLSEMVRLTVRPITVIVTVTIRPHRMRKSRRNRCRRKQRNDVKSCLNTRLRR